MWQVTIHSEYGADLRMFDTKKDALKFALDVEKDKVVFGTEIKYISE